MIFSHPCKMVTTIRVRVRTFAVRSGNLFLLAGPDVEVVVAVRVLVGRKFVAEAVHRVRPDILEIPQVLIVEFSSLARDFIVID